MNSITQKQRKPFSLLLASACGAASLLSGILGISSSATASQPTLFSCSAKNVIVEVKRLNHGTLRYEAYNIPTNLKRPDLAINNGTIRRGRNGETLYSFRNNIYQYVAVKDGGYGKVLVYKNAKLIGTNYCGDL
ncbi:hypothetical protein [Fischerella thermalis]|uniref:hypothetical protein n=1 Tax=Fischerella thermalis TaxID=372787 RepID=UPI001A0505DF|nr:hypothetical protein [Fischerella thermalis]MBF1987911.1 hypothetical protein [Fischerella thermalis M58_A2018_009]MBF2061716.1 hypothetical protein [Fischerella thermalis M66_A2018_004]